MIRYLLFFVLFFVGCNTSTEFEHSDSAISKIIEHDTVQILVRIDTLVIIQTYDTVALPDTSGGGLYMVYGGWSEVHQDAFTNGKTIDTIRKHTIIYK